MSPDRDRYARIRTSHAALGSSGRIVGNLTLPGYGVARKPPGKEHSPSGTDVSAIAASRTRLSLAYKLECRSRRLSRELESLCRRLEPVRERHRHPLRKKFSLPVHSHAPLPDALRLLFFGQVGTA